MSHVRREPCNQRIPHRNGALVAQRLVAVAPDQHVAAPDGVRGVALQRVLVEHVRPAVRHRVVDQQPLLEVLAALRKGNYINMNRGKLVSIHRLPAEY